MKGVIHCSGKFTCTVSNLLLDTKVIIRLTEAGTLLDSHVGQLHSRTGVERTNVLKTIVEWLDSTSSIGKATGRLDDRLCSGCSYEARYQSGTSHSSMHVAVKISLGNVTARKEV